MVDGDGIRDIIKRNNESAGIKVDLNDDRVFVDFVYPLEPKDTEVCTPKMSAREAIARDLMINYEGLVIGKNGGKKCNKYKNRLELLPWEALLEVGKVLTFGAAKYEDENWKKVEPKNFRGAILRHYADNEIGEDYDKETGLLHYAHMACNALFLLYLKIKEKENESKNK